MAIRQRSAYRLDELDNLIRHLRFDPVPEEELARRRRLAEVSRCILQQQAPLSIPIEDLTEDLTRAEDDGESG